MLSGMPPAKRSDQAVPAALLLHIDRIIDFVPEFAQRETTEAIVPRAFHEICD